MPTPCDLQLASEQAGPRLSAGPTRRGLPRRVCVVARASVARAIGGMQNHTADLVRGLVERGIAVEVISARHPDGIPEEWVDGAHWRFVDALGNSFTERDWLEQSYAEFRRAEADGRFDLVHSEGSSALGLVANRVQLETPLIVLFHGNYLGLAKANLGRQRAAHSPQAIVREQWALLSLTRRHFTRGNWYRFRGCEAIVPSAQQVKDTRRSHLLAPARVHVVPNGVDTDMFKPRPRTDARAALGLPEGFTILSAGRLTHDKGNHTLVEVLAALAATGAAPSARLDILGDGPEAGALETLAGRLGLGDRVRLHGRQPRERVAEFLAAADVFAFPTQRDEAAPLVVVEAMASGTPIVASARGGIAEVIDRPMENGMLVRPGDTKGFTNAIRLLHDDPALRERIAEAGIARVKAHYTIDQMIESTLEVYQLALTRADGVGRWRWR